MPVDPQYEDMFEHGNYKRRRRMKRPYSLGSRGTTAAAAAAAAAAAMMSKSIFGADQLSGHMGHLTGSRTLFPVSPTYPANMCTSTSWSPATSQSHQSTSYAHGGHHHHYHPANFNMIPSGYRKPTEVSQLDQQKLDYDQVLQFYCPQ